MRQCATLAQLGWKNRLAGMHFLLKVLYLI
jgi:hypothetical protein